MKILTLGLRLTLCFLDVFARSRRRARSRKEQEQERKQREGTRKSYFIKNTTPATHVTGAMVATYQCYVQGHGTG